MQGLPSQVEVTLLTVREEEEVRKMLLRASEHISLDQLRKMCVVCVSDPDRVAQPREEKDGEASLGLNCSQFDLGTLYTFILSFELFVRYTQSTIYLRQD